jgi:hypothetical protein
MRRHHARVRRIELPADPLLVAPRADRLHSIRHDEERAVVHLGDEVAQRQPNRPGQPHRPAIACNRREVAIGRRQPRRIAAANRRDHLGFGGTRQPGESRTDQIDDAINTVQHICDL